MRIWLDTLRLMKSLLYLRRMAGGLGARKKIKRGTWGEFWKTLRPVENGYELVRIGGKEDGGYLVPLDLEGISRCISPGVANVLQFEKELLNLWNIPSLLLDASIRKPERIDARLKFLPRFLVQKIKMTSYP